MSISALDALPNASEKMGTLLLLSVALTTRPPSPLATARTVTDGRDVHTVVDGATVSAVDVYVLTHGDVTELKSPVFDGNVKT